MSMHTSDAAIHAKISDGELAIWSLGECCLRSIPKGSLSSFWRLKMRRYLVCFSQTDGDVTFTILLEKSRKTCSISHSTKYGAPISTMALGKAIHLEALKIFDGNG
nr:unnamed protein product [Callosobruchus chinensis]